MERGNLITVTVDINDRIHLAWGTPTTGASDDAPAGVPLRRATDLLSSVAVEGVEDVRLRDDGREAIFVYGRRCSRVVVTRSDVLGVLIKCSIDRILAPTYFIRSRTGGRIAVRKDGVELSVLAVLGEYLGISDPSWRTTNCWREDFDEVVSKTAFPIGGTKAYAKAYYAKTIEVRRKQARASAKQRRQTDRIDELIALAKRGGGGGPF